MKILLLPIVLSAVLISYGWSQNPLMDDKGAVCIKPAGGQYEKVSIEDILNQSEDPELIRLSGEIIKKLQGRTYLFRDETGEVRVRIDDESVPEKGVKFNVPMTISGEVEPASDKKPVRVDAERIRYCF